MNNRSFFSRSIIVRRKADKKGEEIIVQYSTQQRIQDRPLFFSASEICKI